MIKFECVYCKQIYEFDKVQQSGAHVRNCIANPNKDKIIFNITNSNKKRINEKLGEYKEFTVQCHKCNNNIQS